MRMVVCGSRSWRSQSLIRGWLFRLQPDLILHGGAEGADSIAGEVAEGLGIRTLVYRPDYEVFGPQATHVRNDQMLDQADYVLAFWDGKSRGTKSVIEKAERRGIPKKVIRA